MLMVPIKALSMKHPWGGHVAELFKPIETRTWTTKYRGPLLICISRSIDKSPAAQRAGFPYSTGEAYLERGRAIAIAQLVDVRPMTKADELGALYPYEPGRFAWILEGVRRIPSFPVKGALGLFNVSVPLELLEKRTTYRIDIRTLRRIGGSLVSSRRSCRSCGCTEERACVGGCSWVSRDRCSACPPHVAGATRSAGSC